MPKVHNTLDTFCGKLSLIIITVSALAAYIRSRPELLGYGVIVVVILVALIRYAEAGLLPDEKDSDDQD